MPPKPLASPWWAAPPWRWFYSLKIGLVLLGLITVASVIGTLINPLQEAQRLVYYSWWFQSLLLLLAINLTAATLRTITLKVIPCWRPRFIRTLSFYQQARPTQQIAYEGDAEQVAQGFRRLGFRSWQEGSAGFAVRGRLNRLGAVISHLGLILILVGGFATAWLAEEGYLRLEEGTATRQAVITTGEAPERRALDFSVSCEDFDTDFFPQTRIPSHFVSHVSILEAEQPLRLDSVEVNHSVKAGGWMLHQTSYEELPGKQRYRLAVANPASGFTPLVLELSPGQCRPVPADPSIHVALSSGLPLRWTVERSGVAEQSGSLSGTTGNLRVVAEQFEPDFMIDANRQIASRSREMNNPALRVAVYEGEQLVARPWLFGREDLKAMAHGNNSPYKLELASITGSDPEWQFTITVASADRQLPLGSLQLALGDEQQLTPSETATTEVAEATGPWQVELVETVPAYATVLTMTRNPVLPFIYLGCAVMLLGLVFTFMLRRREIWFLVDQKQRLLYLAGVFPAGQQSWDRPLQEFFDDLSKIRQPLPQTGTGTPTGTDSAGLQDVG